jgi:hypothetical protein
LQGVHYFGFGAHRSDFEDHRYGFGAHRSGFGARQPFFEVPRFSCLSRQSYIEQCYGPSPIVLPKKIP